MNDGDSLLSLRGLDKRFPGVHVLRAVDLDIFKGEIHGLVGENGAGKSTLIKILTGVVRKTAGQIILDGRDVEFSGPRQALDAGIAAIHQEIVLCPHLTVAENLFLGMEPVRWGMVRARAMQRAAELALADVGFDIDASARLGDLSIGQQQLAATAQAAARDVRLIVFDEPTAYLTRRESQQLFDLMGRLHAKGVTIVYISHHLEEVIQLASRISVLRDGQVVSTRSVDTADPARMIGELVHDMVARNIEQIHVKEDVPIGEEVLRVDGLSGAGFSDISLDVRRGEIVGLYGLIGSGRSEFVKSLFGRYRPTAGSVVWKGEIARIRKERDAIDLGMALLPESRRDEGLCLNQSVRVNLNLTDYEPISVAGFVNAASERARAERQIKDLRIVARNQEAHVARLSGGNQQKIVLGKWLVHGADLLIADEPMVGVDVGTKAEICRLFASLLRNGTALILISSYLPEVLDLSDRLHVFRSGKIVASYRRGDANHEVILAAAIGA